MTTTETDLRLNEADVANAQAELSEDGDTCLLPDGRRLVLKIRPDEDHSVMDDGDWFGKLEWPETNCCTGHYILPDGFTGNAELLGFGRSYDRIWWEPPSDVPRTSEHFASLRRSLLDRLEYGYSLVGLALEERCDHHGWHEIAGTWLGGVDEFYPELIPDLIGELSTSSDRRMVVEGGHMSTMNEDEQEAHRVSLSNLRTARAAMENDVLTCLRFVHAETPLTDGQIIALHLVDLAEMLHQRIDNLYVLMEGAGT